MLFCRVTALEDPVTPASLIMETSFLLFVSSLLCEYVCMCVSYVLRSC